MSLHQQNTDSLMQQSMLNQLANTALNEEQLSSVNDKVLRIDNLVKEFNVARSNIENNGDLSPSGKQSSINDLRLNKAKSLSTIATTESLDKRIAEIRLTLVPSDKFKKEPAVDAMRQHEIRNILRQMDELKVVELYLDISVSGRDDETMRAIEDSPASFPLISDLSIIEKGKHARAERESPESKKLLNQLISMRSTLQNAIDTAKSSMQITEEDSLLKMASGEV